MLKRLQRKLTSPAQQATPPPWQELLQQRTAVAEAPPGRLITPAPPPGVPAPSRPAPRDAYASQGDVLAWSGNTREARRAYESEATKSPIDPLPLVQMIRLSIAGGSGDTANVADLAQLRARLEARVPHAAQRVLAWFSLYQPRSRNGSRWTCSSLALLVAQSEVGKSDPVAIKEVLTAPSPQGKTWLEYAAAHQKAADVEVLLSLCQDADAWESSALVRALVTALEHRDVATCTVLVRDRRVDVCALGERDANSLVTLGSRSGDDRLEAALAKRHIRDPGALACALQHHSHKRAMAQVEYVSWGDPASSSVVQLALQRHSGRLELVRAFIGAGMPINAIYAGETPLMSAVAANAPDVVRLLVQAGADRLDPSTMPDASDRPDCARELRYPDVLAETRAHILGNVANLDAKTQNEIDALLIAIDPADFEASVHLFLSLWKGPACAAEATLETLQRIVRFSERAGSLTGQLASRWIEPFNQPGSRQFMFNLFYQTRSEVWSRVSAALDELSRRVPMGDAPDAWILQHQQTIAAVFSHWAQVNKPPASTYPAPKQTTPAAAAILQPRDANAPFPFHTSHGRERHLSDDLAQFLETVRPPLIEDASEEVCGQVEMLLRHGDTLDALAEKRVALAYLQLIQSLVGATTLADVFKSEQARANSMPIKKLQLKAHPDKGGTPGLASCLNALVETLSDKTANQQAAALLRQAFDATAKKRAAFYAGAPAW